MTKKEKIALLVDELEDIRCDNFDADTNEDKTLKEAIRAIKELEQEPILDKIRAEIAEMPKTYPFTDHIYSYVKVRDILKIIDKYKAESEDKHE